MDSELIKKVADHMVQRTALKHATYSNPYHPEDSIVILNEETAANARIDENIEKENDNFVSGGEEANEDQLTESDKPKNSGVKVEKKTIRNENLTTQRPKYPLIRNNFADKEVKVPKESTFKSIQRRFVLKGSN
ncbi:hypothetical protein ABMA28_001595 [Loxostege sticticalis]|uniref:Uncharacterized protein n=1 Tax=Loxostege sticticalis TaxID=481309 RepID=A0ABD0T2A1_LOXSC